MNRRSFLRRIVTAAVAMAAAPVIVRQAIAAQLPFIDVPYMANLNDFELWCGWDAGVSSRTVRIFSDGRMVHWL